MRLYRISKCNYIEDLSGTGAAMFGGRWNSKGTYILYTAESASLALLETVVHLAGVASTDFCMLCIEVPADSIEEITEADLIENWQRNPPPSILKKTGDQFVEKNKALLLKVPSAIIPESNNYLINPMHKDFKLIKNIYIKPLPLDPRLVK